jgi:hypothetical protein
MRDLSEICLHAAMISKRPQGDQLWERLCDEMKEGSSDIKLADRVEQE